METQQEFMLLFRMQPSTEAPTPEQVATMHQAWGTFIGGIAAKAKLVSTSRLGFEGHLIDRSKRTEPGIKVTDGEALSGNMVIKAASLQEASEWAKGCPVLDIGGSVEVRSIMPMEA